MALRILSPSEVGQRVAEVRRRLGLGSVEMSLAMGRDKQFISRIETGKRKRIERSEHVDIANFAEHKGDFAEIDARTILSYLDGDFDSWDVKLRPNLSLVIGGQPGGAATDNSLDSAPEDDSSGRYLHLALAQAC